MPALADAPADSPAAGSPAAVLEDLRAAEDAPPVEPPAGFFPDRPETLEEAKLSREDLEDLVLKVLLNRGAATGADVARTLSLPRHLMGQFLRELKAEHVVGYRKNAGPDDYLHDLTNRGAGRAARAHDRCRYHGTAPVALDDYVASVAAQSLRTQTITKDALRRALRGIQVSPAMFSEIGAALGSVGAMFLYGPPGNGKTTIAERLTAAYGSHLWIPRAVRVGSETVRLFDAAVHKEAPAERDPRRPHDERWVRIERPTVIVGGELTLDHLELSHNRATGVMEAPVQMKANGGTLVVDDFGRQRMSTDALLNRWIVPLERGYDFLNTPGGHKVKVPFDLLTVFATNLEPKDLVDEAFLRRIPFKVRAADPTPAQFLALTHHLAPEIGLEIEPGAVETLVTEHFLNVDRPLRFCHPRDLLLQVKRHADFEGTPPVATADAFAAAVANYFSDL